MGGRELYHLAGADKQDADLAQVFEQLACEAHCGGGHADAVLADLGGAAHLLGDGKAALEQLIERAAERARGFGGANGVFHLAEDLCFAQHHGVKTAGNAKRMACGQAFFEQIGVRTQNFGAHAAAVREPVQGVIQRRGAGGTVDFGAVAGR